MWNPLLELLFHEQVSGIFESIVVEIDLARIALSCHFALALLRRRCVWFCMTFHRAPLSLEFLYSFVAPLPPLRHCDSPVVGALATIFCSCLGAAIDRRYATCTFVWCSSAYTSWTWNRRHKYGIVPICGCRLVTLLEFGVVALRENVPGIFLLLGAGGYQLVHVQGHVSLVAVYITMGDMSHQLWNHRLVLLLCLLFFSLGLHVESSPVSKHSSKNTLCKESPVGIHNTCNHVCGVFPSTWVPQVLVWHQCHHVFAMSWTRQSRPSPFFPRENNFSIETTKCVLSVPLITRGLHYSRW